VLLPVTGELLAARRHVRRAAAEITADGRIRAAPETQPAG